MEIEAAVAQLRLDSLSILLVEQYLEFALRLCDRYVVLDAGEVERTGPASELADPEVRRLPSVQRARPGGQTAPSPGTEHSAITVRHGKERNDAPAR